jgi:hypothetical protein
MNFSRLSLRLFFWVQRSACRVLQILDREIMCESFAECLLDLGFAG